MKRFKRKPYGGRRGKEEGLKHWLGAGEAGQESLFLDLDPYLYAADGAISRHITRLAHAYDGDQQKPLAVLVPPPGTVGWQLGMLARLYRVMVWTADDDPLLEGAIDRFDATRFSGDLPATLMGAVDLFLFTDVDWEDWQDFLTGVREARQHLSSSGQALFLLRSFEERGSYRTRWRDAGEASLDALAAGSLFALPAADSITIVDLGMIEHGDGDGLSTFLKRHRDFFGRNARELCLARMSDPDFRQSFRPGEAVALLSWSAEESPKTD